MPHKDPTDREVMPLVREIAERGDKYLAKTIADLEKFAGWEPRESPRAAAMHEAAGLLRLLGPRPKHVLDDPNFQARGYQIDMDTRNHQLRLSFFRERQQKGPLGFIILEAPEIYDLGRDLIKHYDNLEGIK